jgi:hypothetical protein
MRKDSYVWQFRWRNIEIEFFEVNLGGNGGNEIYSINHGLKPMAMYNGETINRVEKSLAMLNFLNPTGSNNYNLKCINVMYDPGGVERIDVRMISIKIQSLRDFGFCKN